MPSSRTRSEKMAEESNRQVLPTAMGFAAKEAIAALRNHRIPAVAQVKFLDYAAEAMNDSAFGLHLVEQTDPRDAGIYFYVASAAKDIDEALALYARYFRIVNEAVRLKLTRS